MAEIKVILARPIQLADQITKAADDATNCKQECADLKSKTEKLAALLRQAARASSDLYERPATRIINETAQALDKALSLVLKCSGNGLMKRVFTIIPAAAFRKSGSQLENSIGDVSWLLRVSASAEDRGDEYLGLPPIAANEPILGLIWEQIAILSTGSPEDRSDAAASLVSLAKDSERYGKRIIEEGGVGALLKLLKEGKVEGQENAANAIGLLGRDPENVEAMIQAGVCQVFAKVLKEGPMKVQAVVAWAISELVSTYPKCQDLFEQHYIIRSLVGHLAFETIQEHSKYNITTNKATSIHALVMASNPKGNNNNIVYKAETDDDRQLQSRILHPMGNRTPNQMHSVVTNSINMLSAGLTAAATATPQASSHGDIHSLSINGKQILPHHSPYLHHAHSGPSSKGRELEDPATKTKMKAMAAKAIWQLAKGNLTICRSITESRALLCFAVLLEKGEQNVRHNSAMALMEITAMAEHDPDLRRSAFKPTSPACRAVVEQLLKIIEKEDADLLIPCIKSIGHLARTFRATEKRMIFPLVQLLDERENDVQKEACIALTKFACKKNFLHINHCEEIIAAGGAKNLVQLVYLGEPSVQKEAVTLLCYIALHLPDREELARAEVLPVIERASKQSHLTQDETLETLLYEAGSKLELFQSRGPRGYH